MNYYGYKNYGKEVIEHDITSEDILERIDNAVNGRTVDVIIGGPPCQAYSLAGRIRDPHGMKEDYRNYLFESYIRILEHFKPSFFIFENVVGMLSAAPDGTPIVDKIRKAFDDAGYLVIDNFKNAVFDVADFGIPQHRKRVIILGVRKDSVFKNVNEEGGISSIINEFYSEIMPKLKKESKPRTVRDAISDLPVLMPTKDVIRTNGHKYSHAPIESVGVFNHNPRFHSERDQKVFRLLGEDLESGR